MNDSSTNVGERVRRRAPAFWHFVVRRFKHGERYGLDFTLAFIAILAAMWGFVEIVDAAVTETELNALDRRLQTIMSAILSPDLTGYFIFITNVGGTRGTVIGVLLIGLPLLFRRRWWSLFGLVFASAGGGLILWGLKLFFQRARPVETVIEAGGYAFPSGHAFAAMVFFGYLIFLTYRHFRAAALQVFVTLFSSIMIFFIGTSRVYLNVHWLTDVVGGWIAGFAWLLISILIVRHVEWPHRSQRPVVTSQPPPETGGIEPPPPEIGGK